MSMPLTIGPNVSNGSNPSATIRTLSIAVESATDVIGGNQRKI